MLSQANPPAAHKIPSSSEGKRHQPLRCQRGELETCTSSAAGVLTDFFSPLSIRQGPWCQQTLLLSRTSLNPEPTQNTSTDSAGTGPLQTFLKRKGSSRAPGGTGSKAMLDALRVPCVTRFQTRKEVERPQVPALSHPPIPDYLVGHILSLDPGPTPAPEFRKRSGPRYETNMEERFCSGPLCISPPGLPRPLRRARELGTRGKFRRRCPGRRLFPSIRVTAPPRCEAQRGETLAVSPDPWPFRPCRARAAPRAGPRLRSSPELT